MKKEILVVGSVALDTVETPWGRAEEALGGSAIYFSAAASYFVPVNVVGVVGTDFPFTKINFLRDRGVNFDGLQEKEGRTFRWTGHYQHDLNQRDTLETQLNVYADFRPSIPPAYKDSPYLFLANIDPDLQLNVLDQVSSPKLIVLDTMNLWIERKLDSLREVIPCIDIFIVNDEEAGQLTGEANLIRAARQLLSWGPKVIVVKKGEHGSVMVGPDFIFSAPAYPLERVTDPTGAGDSFAGGFVGTLARKGSLSEKYLRQAVVYGSVLASFCVEEFSIGGLKNLCRARIEERYQEFKRITFFEA